MKLSWEQAETEGVWVGETGVPGPTLGIMGGVHGNELSGIEVVSNLRSQSLDIVGGSVVLMLGNLRAIDEDVRFTEVNLNRSFRHLTEQEMELGIEGLSYEVQRAQELLPYLDQTDALLDLHEFDFRDLDPFIICERNALQTAKRIGAPIISFGWSQSEAGGTDGYMYENGKEGICYELGDLTDPEGNIRRGHEAVKRFFSAHGLLAESFEPLYAEPVYVQTDFAHVRTGEEFHMQREFTTFEPLKEGEIIAIEDGSPIVAGKDEVIIFPKQNPQLNAEAFTIGKVISE